MRRMISQSVGFFFLCFIPCKSSKFEHSNSLSEATHSIQNEISKIPKEKNFRKIAFRNQRILIKGWNCKPVCIKSSLPYSHQSISPSVPCLPNKSVRCSAIRSRFFEELNRYVKIPHRYRRYYHDG